MSSQPEISKPGEFLEPDTNQKARGVEASASEPTDATTVPSTVTPDAESTGQPLSAEARSDDVQLLFGADVPDQIAPSATEAEDDAVVELGGSPVAAESVTSPSMQPIRPTENWITTGESVVLSGSEDAAEMAEAIPFAEEVVPEPSPSAPETMEVASPEASVSSSSASDAPSIPMPSEKAELSSDIHSGTLPPQPAAESSNLFGPLLTQPASESSHILGGRPTPPMGEDSALSFLGQFRQTPGNSDEPPLAEDVSSGHFKPPADAPDYAAAPFPVPEASNILADLLQTGHHSSAVRLENPGIGGTLRRPGSSTESGFDIDVDLGPVPKELEEAEQAAASNILESPYHRQPPSEATIPEVYIEDPQEHILSAVPPPPRDPSSIFDADLDLPAATELLENAAAPSPATPGTIKPTDSGIIEWSVDEVSPAAPTSDILSSEVAAGTTAPRSAIIKPASSAAMPRPAPEAAPEPSPSLAEAVVPSTVARQREAIQSTDEPFRTTTARSTLSAWLGGALLGGALPLGIGAALYFSGVVAPTATLENRSREVEQQATALRDQLDNAQQQLTQTREQLQRTQQELIQNQQLVHLTHKEKDQLADQFQQASRQLQQVQTRLQEVERQLQTTLQTRKQLEAERLQLEKNLAKVQDDLRHAVAQREELDKQLVQAGDNKKKLEAELLQVRGQLEKLDKQLQEVAIQRQNLEKQVQQSQQLLLALAKELQAARLLTEQFDPSALLEAQRRLIALLTSKPDLQQLRRLEEEKRELTAAIRRLEQDVKNQSEAFAKERRNLQEQAAAELKRQREQLQAENQKRLEQLQNDLQQARRQQAAMEQKLAQAVADSDVLHLWLQLLAEGRRPSDVPAARQAAQKILQRVNPASEEAAQAHVLLALAAVVTGQTADALHHLQQARQSPAYETAQRNQRSWVAIAEQTRVAVDDPLAALRRPPQEQPRDPQLALLHLNEAVLAYRQGRFDQAAAAAQRAVLCDPTHPAAWYYLGAAHWMLGQLEQAADDFRQGSERERTTRLSARQLNDLLSPIQGVARERLEATRP